MHDLSDCATRIVKEPAVILPIITGLITNYIYDRLKPDNSIVKCEIIITDEVGNGKLIKYNGPAKEYEETMSKIFE